MNKHEVICMQQRHAKGLSQNRKYFVLDTCRELKPVLCDQSKCSTIFDVTLTFFLHIFHHVSGAQKIFFLVCSLICKVSNLVRANVVHCTAKSKPMRGPDII